MNNRMLLRPILSRIHQYRRSANFCSLNDVESSPGSPEYGSSPEKGYVISYLVNSCGLSPATAPAVSKKVNFDGPDRPNAVLYFLKKQGFTKIQIAEFVTRYPRFLLCKPDTSLSPKIQFFLRFFTGISEKDVLKTVSRYPHLLTLSLEHRLEPMYDYLKGIIGNDKLETLFRRGAWCFNFDFPNRVIPNVDFLRNLGVPNSCIELSLFHFPDVYCYKHAQFRKVVEEVKGMGLDPTKSMFLLAIHARTGKSNLALWDRCYEVYSKWGWSRDDILMAFRKHPNCMLLSEKKISGVLDFVVNKLGRESRLVAMYPFIMFYNTEKRIIPRCSVVRLLSLKGLVKRDWSLSSVLCPAEKVFLDQFVTRYKKEVPELHDIYVSKKARAVDADN